MRVGKTVRDVGVVIIFKKTVLTNKWNPWEQVQLGKIPGSI